MSEKYTNPAVTVDIVIFSVFDDTLKVLLIKRKYQPFDNCWAIPGGFVDYNEPLESAALRELEEETGIKDVYLEQLHTIGTPGRDPRERTVSVVYFALLNSKNFKIKAQSDAKEAAWFNVKELPELAFDHNDILSCAIETLRLKLENFPIAKELLSDNFTLNQLQKLYEIILDRKIDEGRFKCEILKMNFIEKTGAHVYGFKKHISFSSRFY
ncbi:MAG: NUDIX domain-containing protein [Candidatus Gastranaerophilales bacterium]|nr:NUDIX domain-containing protein [Candidatus Gastranaerophilales bacterium]